MAMARSQSDTRCSLPAFVRPARTVHTLAATSNSSNKAPIVSSARAAVKMVNSRARAVTPCVARGRAMNAGNVLVGQRWVMLDGGDLGLGGQDHSEMAAPRCGFCAVAQIVALACLGAARKAKRKSSAEWRSPSYGTLEPLRALWLEPARAPEWLVAALHYLALAALELSR